MKFIFLILFIFISNTILANEDNSSEEIEVEVINLHDSKSLDQMVLENLNSKNEEKDTAEDSKEINEIKPMKLK